VADSATVPSILRLPEDDVSGARPDLPLLLQAFATFAMTGLIWFVQVVHYPLFGVVGSNGYAAYQEEHMRLTTRVVAPLMALEAATALWLVLDRPRFVSPTQAWTGLILLAVIWSSTAWLSVPRHEALLRGFDASAHAALVSTNWIRTAAWTGRSILLLVALRGARL
jgi:hypothetical protein